MKDSFTHLIERWQLEFIQASIQRIDDMLHWRTILGGHRQRHKRSRPIVIAIHSKAVHVDRESFRFRHRFPDRLDKRLDPVMLENHGPGQANVQLISRMEDDILPIGGDVFGYLTLQFGDLVVLVDCIIVWERLLGLIYIIFLFESELINY